MTGEEILGLLMLVAMISIIFIGFPIAFTLLFIALFFGGIGLGTELTFNLGYTAVLSGRAVFLYGATGTGKTTIAVTLTRIFEQDRIWLPYAGKLMARSLQYMMPCCTAR